LEPLRTTLVGNVASLINYEKVCESVVHYILFFLFLVVCSWRKLFRSRLVNALASYGNVYFTVFMAILVILFLGKIANAVAGKV